MIDIGVNLLHPQFDDDRDAVLERARQAGVDTLIVTSTDLTMAERAIDFCSARDLFCTAGVHPHDAKHAPANLSQVLESLAAQPPVCAIGETGLDFNRNFSPPDVQRRVFAMQLELAARTGLAVFVHDRDSNGEVHRMLAPLARDLSGVVVHCFTGTEQDLENYLNAGFSIGVTGWVCDPKRGAALAALVPRIPGDRLLVETDAPFLLPPTRADGWPPAAVSRRHKRRNEPMLLPRIIARLAQLRDEDPEVLAATTAVNARRLFSLPAQSD